MDHHFISLCEYGNLEGAKDYVEHNYYLRFINHDSYNEAFYLACKKGHLQTAKWLLSRNPCIRIDLMDIYFKHDPFVRACENGRLDVAQWLLQIKPKFDMTTHNHYIFRQTCINGHLEVAKWLLNVKPNIDITAQNSEAFRTCCKEQKLDIVQWLCQIKPYLYIVCYDENGLIKDFEIREKEEANWQQRKYLVWLASEQCPEENKTNLLYKLPSDVSRLVIGFV